ncbi:hypothetical protein GOB42_27035 [Sinorhizobium meliloti]|uniref:ribosome modulation factor n=1 Tax=Rhizobium meliloti TaxID=382 RepID=UPI0001E4B51E|nr:hypothetical protein [Sinorhizobium meliloti]AEG54056.1 hypothetical protein Sinme_2339 [Sinorhizobium meliloti AK83]MDE4590225.1 hypothetical protein [Sinorhizobium meliloti]MDW9794373.1 hypothetical protein [Sinorhizobium meliloti]MDX0107380.1 hypothetical protein [Sinorhizobium meliloti]MDX0136428.1 hypothetical protein [Sinorhizobium meliloti]
MPATIGDNSKDLTPAEQKALFMHHLGEILKQTDICKAENAKRLALRKQAKADGIVLADIDFGLRCAQIEDQQIIINEQQRRAQIGQYFALPIGAQTEFDFDSEPAVDRARREGERAGYEAASPNTNPYDENSAQGRAWAKGWKEAQAEMAANLQSAMEKKQADRAKKAADLAAADDGGNDPEDDDEADLAEAAE